MWEPCHNGLEPQTPHNGIIQCAYVTKGTFQLTYQILTNKCRVNGMMMDPYPHSQHMKVVNHLVYVWESCHMGSVPHSSLTREGIIQCAHVTKVFGQLSTFGPTSVVVMTW